MEKMYFAFPFDVLRLLLLNSPDGQKRKQLWTVAAVSYLAHLVEFSWALAVWIVSTEHWGNVSVCILGGCDQQEKEFFLGTGQEAKRQKRVIEEAKKKKDKTTKCVTIRQE